MPYDVPEIIEKLNGPEELAARLGNRIKPGTVRVWRHRNSIPLKHHAAISELLRKRGLPGMGALGEDVAEEISEDPFEGMS